MKKSGQTLRILYNTWQIITGSWFI